MEVKKAQLRQTKKRRVIQSREKRKERKKPALYLETFPADRLSQNIFKTLSTICKKAKTNKKSPRDPLQDAFEVVQERLGYKQ
jgi:hypothetical protein